MKSIHKTNRLSSSSESQFHLSRYLQLAAVLLLALLAAPPISAQEVTDTIKIRTRVVFLDALVKDKKTKIPISDLKPDNFELLDEGKPRVISYFTREGQARKPLAMVLILDLRDDGAGRFLKREEVRAAMLEELVTLSPGEEVAILAINASSIDDKSAAIRNGHALWLSDFTRDKAQLEAALGRIPALLAAPVTPSQADEGKKQDGSMTNSARTEPAKEAAPQEKQPAENNNVIETETIKGKNGAVITRTTMKDGSVNIKRVNAKGNVVVDLDNVYDLAGAARDATDFVEQKRPNSQAAIVWLSDGIAPIFKEDVAATEQILIKQNAIFNALNVDMRTLYKFLVPFGQPLIGWTGISLAGSAKHLAQQTGGETIRVSRVRDYGAALAKVIGNLNARYTLGFSLAEDEKDDGRMHELVLRVRAPDAKGKERRLEVSSRRGYFMPKGENEQAATTK